jgi:sugar transferase (PEP-CTERM/EpsH1 system associated)
MRILYLTTRLPYAPNRGDRIRSYYILREMSRFAEVSVFSLVHDDDEAQHADQVPFARRVATARPPRLRNMTRALANLHTPTPLTHLLFRTGESGRHLTSMIADAPPDLVVAHCSGIANLALEPPLAGRPLAIDMVDVDSAKWSRLADEQLGLKQWIYRREARTLRRFEADIARRAMVTLVVNERERETMLEVAPDARVEVVPNGIDVHTFRPPMPASTSPTVVFCGVMNYTPNELGVQWFVRNVWPAVRSRRPDAKFVIVGSGPTRSVQALASPDNSVEVTGAVASVQPYLWNAAVAVAPIFVAQGVQNKVLEALAAGLPVVTTPAVAAGLQDTTKAGCTIVEDPKAFADAVLGLLSADPARRREQAAAARIDELGWPTTLRQLETLLAVNGSLSA